MKFKKALEYELKAIKELRDIKPVVVPRGTKPPYCAYRQVGGNEKSTLSGYTGNITKNFEVCFIDKHYDKLDQITEQALRILKGLDLQPIGKEGMELQNIEVQEPIDGYEPEIDLYATTINIQVTYNK